LRIAALYDVHGMLAPLAAVLAEVEREDVDAIVLGGDCIQGPQSGETLERLRALGDRALWLRGNTDRLIAEHAGEDNVHGQVAKTIGADAVAFLRDLPFSHTLRLDGLGRVLFCHATPWSDEAFLAPDDTLDGVDADVVVVGHTHEQEDRSIGAARWVNAGSVGMPRGELVSGWALIGRRGAGSTEPRRSGGAGSAGAGAGPTVELRRTPYDVGAALAALRAVGGDVAEYWIADIARRARA
jgi:putative phosphoesterase